MSVRLDILAAGSCRDPERVVRRGGSWRPVDLPSLVGVITHPERGVLLYDTGYAPRFFTETARLPASLYARLTPVSCTAQDTAAAQLRRAGIEPDDVSLVVISHFHADHIGGLRDFPAARFLYFRAALDPRWRAHGPLRQLHRGLLPGLLPPDFEARSEFVESVPRVPLPLHGADLGPGYDLLGDGSVLGIDLSGHVPGQLGLLVSLPGRASVLLAADACWSGRAVTHGELPHPIAALITGDWPGYRRVVAALGQVTAPGGDLLIVPSHCAPSIARATELLGR
jgi:glyoxylase-like metal-dependent hydrolase (beta-lactamase superfamily II)